MHCALVAFTQPANRDVKRLDALLRSKIYSNFAEQVSGVLDRSKEVLKSSSMVYRSFVPSARFQNLRRDWPDQ